MLRSLTVIALIVQLSALSGRPMAAQDDSSAADLAALEEQAMKTAVATVTASVVRIETIGGLEQVGGRLAGTGPTTGVIVSDDGYVLSSAFNFAGQPASILVTLASGNRASAKIVARDSSRMLVLLKVNSKEKLKPIEFVPRQEMVVGQWTIAVGRTFDGPPNMSVGVLSARGRIWNKAIQTDAKISPANYGGPLVDIRGRGLGVLVPLSPQRQSELAGAEWYDSGIGFAIPLVDVWPKLEVMKKGQDLFPGLLGVTLKSGDQYADPAIIASVAPKSPAAAAPLKVDDKIVEIDGLPIERQTDVKHALGNRYAGDRVQVAVLRGEKRVSSEVVLAKEIPPYEHAFLGILPLREPQHEGQTGIPIRFVYPDSPAAKAGIREKDRLLALGDKEVNSVSAAHEAMAAHEPKTKLAIRIERGGKEQRLEATLAAMPTAIPAGLPPAFHSAPKTEGDRPQVGEVEIKIPEEKNQCFAYVPANYDPQMPHGLVVWLHPPGETDLKKLIARWKQHCEDHHLIVLAPRAADPARWRPTELEFIGKTIDDVVRNYNIDQSRIIAHGHQAGGSMAILLAFERRDLVRGVAPVESRFVFRSRPDNDPVQRLAMFIAYAKKGRSAEAIESGVEMLKGRKFPINVVRLDKPRYLSADEIGLLVRWLDTLDRI